MSEPALILTPIMWMIGCKDAACTRTVAGMGRTSHAAEHDCLENAAEQGWWMQPGPVPLAESWHCPDHLPSFVARRPQEPEDR